MRIWLLNHYAAGPERGVGTRHYDLGRALTARGHEVWVLASAFDHFSHRQTRLSPGERWAVEVVDQVRFVWLRTTPYTGNDSRRALNMASYAAAVLAVQHRLPRPEVVVGSSVHLLAPLVGWVVARLRRAKLLVEVRDLWPQALIDMGVLPPRGPLTAAMRGLEGFLYRRADRVLTLLPGSLDYLAARGAAGKIDYLPNGVALNRADDTPHPLTDQVRRWRHDGRFVAGYVGSHGPANRVDVLVEAARVLAERGERRPLLLFVGDGLDKPAARALAARYRLDDVVRFADPIPKTAVRGLLTELDATLFHVADAPVYRYGLSCNKIFDYLAAGRPMVVAGPVQHNPAVDAGAGIVVPPEDPTAVADALAELLTMPPAERDALGARGLRYVREHHDIEMLADRFLTTLVPA